MLLLERKSVRDKKLNMKNQIVRPTTQFVGSPLVPGDKSISHRALILSALSEGQCTIEGLLESADVQSTAECLQHMGIEIIKKNNLIQVNGQGMFGLKSPKEILNCGNSGTTMRLLMGLLAGQKNFQAGMTGDESLVRRPMKRVADPLRLMGADLNLTDQNFAPLKIKGTKLHGIDYELKIASAQIKTALILAGLTSQGTTRLTGQIHSRDHTERMLKSLGVEIKTSSAQIEIVGGQKILPSKILVPGDPSTAAFWLAGACLVPGANIDMQFISLNPSRLGFVRVLQRMGTPIKIEVTHEHAEPVGRLMLRHSDLVGPLKAVRIEAAEIPAMIDELPLLAVLATQAEGLTEVFGAQELRVKETDRIEAIAINLRLMGIHIEIRPDGFAIQGPQKLRGAAIQSFHDHRIAMAFSIAALVADGESRIDSADCVAVSYPNFFKILQSLTS